MKLTRIIIAGAATIAVCLALSACSGLRGKSFVAGSTFFAGKIVPMTDGSNTVEIVLGEGLADVVTCRPDTEVESFIYQTSIWNSQNVTEGHYVHIIGKNKNYVDGDDDKSNCKLEFASDGTVSIVGGLTLPSGKTVTAIGKIPEGTTIKTISIGTDGKTSISSTATDSNSTNEVSK